MNTTQDKPNHLDAPKDVNAAIYDRGQEIFNLSDEDTTSIFNKDWWYGRIMEWSMKNENFKVQMFRFVDVLPYLNSSDEDDCRPAGLSLDIHRPEPLHSDVLISAGAQGLLGFSTSPGSRISAMWHLSMCLTPRNFRKGDFGELRSAY